MNEQNYTIEQVIEMVNLMPFPAASVGDTVWQYGFKFILTENGWVQFPEKPE